MLEVGGGRHWYTNSIPAAELPRAAQAVRATTAHAALHVAPGPCGGGAVVAGAVIYISAASGCLGPKLKREKLYRSYM